MCSMYWTVKDVAFKCPNCGADTTDDLQTHFMGYVGSCSDGPWAIGERVPHLGNITVSLGKGKADDFAGGCDECDTYYDFAAEIVDGAVVRAWPERAVA